MSIIGMNYTILRAGDRRIADHSKAAQIIAAEIDALTRERDVARVYGKLCDVAANSLNAELKECQSALRLALAGTEQHYFAIPARIDDVRAALAVAQSRLTEARAEVERLKAERDFERNALTALADQYSLLAAERNELKDEVAKLKPYAFVQIAKLKRDSAIKELDGAEDEEERQQCARDLGDWREMAFRATNLMREQWERDRKTMVRVELSDMVKAACS